MLFGKKTTREKVEVKEMQDYFIVGSPEVSIRVSRDISAQELRGKFKNYRQPSIEVFEEALTLMRELPKATLVVDYTGKFEGRSFEQKSKNVYQNTSRSYVEFWI